LKKPKNVLVRLPALPEEPPWHQKPGNVATALTQCESKQENPVVKVRGARGLSPLLPFEPPAII